MSVATPLVLDQLVKALRQAAVYNRHDQAAPRVVLWTDGDRQWSQVAKQVAEAVPELLILDDSECVGLAGPATRIRYLLARGERRETPIVYLPGVSRQSFRGVAGFPAHGLHLYALQFQGQFWAHPNGTDWTPSAFLSSENGGLGLDLARDQATGTALATQLAHVLQTPVDALARKRLEAADFHKLVTSDPVRLLLTWIGDEASFKAGRAKSDWDAFRAVCRESFKIDPEKDGVVTAVERLVGGMGPWNEVWRRYSEAPRSFGGVRKALDRIEPRDLVDAQNDRIPVINRQQEDALRGKFESLAEMPHGDARKALAELCEQHARRASGVWAELGEAPLACAARYLGEMLAAMDAGVPGADWETIAESYVRDGSRVDFAVLRAVDAVRDARDVRSVTEAVRAVYLHWLDGLATRTTQLAASYPKANPSQCASLPTEPHSIVLFVDGLRCDLGVELRRLLESEKFTVQFTTAWAALPTVTATAKPAWAPLASQIAGTTISAGFEPQVAGTERPLRSAEFRKLLEKQGFVWTDVSAVGDPEGRAWTEVGSFDHYGHEQGVRLAWRIDEELTAVVARIRELFAAGWHEVTVVTDHGWLYAPGGLPKVSLPKHLTVTAWGRCAIPEANAQHSFPQVPWFWGGGHAVVLAPGIAVFREGLEYAHGGLSIQEALTPVLRVSAGVNAGKTSRIGELRWAGMRLHVTIEDCSPAITVDVRTKPADPGSSVLDADQRTKSPDGSGKLTLLISEDDLLGQAAVVVLVSNGQVIAKKPITIGES